MSGNEKRVKVKIAKVFFYEPAAPEIGIEHPGKVLAIFDEFAASPSRELLQAVENTGNRFRAFHASMTVSTTQRACLVPNCDDQFPARLHYAIQF